MKRLVLLGAALATFAAGPAWAACSPAQIAGKWTLVMFDGARLCRVDIARTGKISKSQCYFGSFSGSDGPYPGSLKLSKSCAVTGSITIPFNNTKYTIEGSADGSVRTINGVLTTASSFGTFYAYRQ